MRTRLDFDVKWGFNLFDMPSTSKRCKIAIRVFAGLLKCVNLEFFPGLLYYLMVASPSNVRLKIFLRAIRVELRGQEDNLNLVDRKMLKGVFQMDTLETTLWHVGNPLRNLLDF